MESEELMMEELEPEELKMEELMRATMSSAFTAYRAEEWSTTCSTMLT